MTNSTSQATEQKNNGALRFDTGKPQLHNVHPAMWQSRISDKGLTDEVLAMNKIMDDFFYFNVDNFSEGWSKVVSETSFLRMVQVLEFGSKKYDSLNYSKGMLFSRVLNSFRRHILALMSGQELDLAADGTQGKENREFSGLHHDGHLACNFMFMKLYKETGVGTDDRIILMPDGSQINMAKLVVSFPVVAIDGNAKVAPVPKVWTMPLKVGE